MGKKVYALYLAAGFAFGASAALTVTDFKGTVYAPGQATVSCDMAATPRLAWCAFGDRDYGADLAAWPRNESLGTVEAGAMSATFTLPLAAQQAQCARLFLLPGDATGALGYLRSDGSQCLDTGYYPNGTTSVTLDFMLTRTLWNQQRPFGVETSTAGKLTFSTYVNNSDYNGSGSWAWACTNGTGNWKGTIIRPDITPRRTQITLDNFGGRYQVVNSWTNFTETLVVPAAARNGTSSTTLAIFASHGTGYANKLTGEFYGMAIRESGAVVHDFKPYLNAGVPGARDAVAGGFIGNAGTGAFYAGDLTGVSATDASAPIDLANLRTTDVFADVDFWMRGMAVDANGNKILDNNELADSLNRRTFATTVYGATGHRPVISNELVRLPGRGVERRMQTLWFPQDRVYGDAACTNGTFYPCSVKLPRLSDYTNHWSCILRFRPDFTTKNLFSSSQWVLKLGHGSKCGVMFGLSGGDDKSWKYATLYTGGKGLTPMYYNNGNGGWDDTKSRNGCNVQMMVTNGWTDVALSADGQKLTVIVLRDGAKLSDQGGLLQKNTYTVADDVNLAPSPTSDPCLGTEALTSNARPYPVADAKAANNDYKCFCGSIQQFAMWKRSMNEAELLMALGYPRQDTWRVGVEDDDVKEFAGTAPEGGVAVDGETWPVPKAIAAGASVKLAFPLTASLDNLVPQIIRLKATSDSAMGTFDATLNGARIGTKTIRPGDWGRWFAKPEVLKTGDNVLVLTRIDNGSQPFRPDVAAMGGGWQVGKLDNGYSDFAHESYGQFDYYVHDGNMRDVKRVIFGSRYQNREVRMHAYMPRELAGRYDWTFRFKVKGNIYDNSRLRIDLNDAEKFNQLVKLDATYDIPIQADELPAGESVFSIRNLDPTTQSPTKYIAFDYFQLIPSRPPSGTIMILR